MILVHSKLLNYHTQENSDHKHILQITNIKYKRDIRFDWCGVIEKWSDKEVKGSTSHPHAQHYILSFVVPKKKSPQYNLLQLANIQTQWLHE
jgi:hypothetical protein